jgi:uncharacterized protein with GYD domain
VEADESASRADQHNTGVSAVERAKVRPIRSRPGQQDQVRLQVEVDPTAGRTGIGRTLSDSVLQVFEVESQLRFSCTTFAANLASYYTEKRADASLSRALIGQTASISARMPGNRPVPRILAGDSVVVRVDVDRRTPGQLVLVGSDVDRPRLRRLVPLRRQEIPHAPHGVLLLGLEETAPCVGIAAVPIGSLVDGSPRLGAVREPLPSPLATWAQPSSVALIDWTDQGVRDFKDTVDRYEAAEGQFQSLGIRFTNVWWTLGAHDMVTTIEAPDDETPAAALLSVAAQGNVRTTTLRAFNREQARSIISKTG